MNQERKNYVQILMFTFLVAMVVVVAVIQFKNRAAGISLFEQDLNEFDLDAAIEALLPSEEEIQNVFSPKLGARQLQNEEMNFLGRDGSPVRALVQKPEGSGPFPVFILVHGGQSSKRATDTLSKLVGSPLLKNQSFIVVTVDWREIQTGEEDVSDIVSTIDWVQTLSEADKQSIYLFGVDYGAYLALAAAEEKPVSGGAVLGYGYADLVAEYDHLQATAETSARNFLIQTGCDGTVDQRACLRQKSIVNTISLPTLLLYSEKDTVVPPGVSEHLHSLTPEATVVVFSEETEHDFFSNAASESFALGMTELSAWVTNLESKTPVQGPLLPGDTADGTGAEPVEPETTPDAESEIGTNTPTSKPGGLSGANTIDEIE